MIPEVPYQRQHLALIEDLAMVVTARAAVSGESVHVGLSSDLAGRLRLHHGLARILAAAGGHAGLVDDLAAGLRSADGLAAVLSAGAGAGRPEPTAPQSPAGTAEPGALDTIRSALDLHRLMLRTNHRHRHLHQAMRSLENMLQILASMPARAVDARAETFPEQVEDCWGLLERAIRVMAMSVSQDVQPPPSRLAAGFYASTAPVNAMAAPGDGLSVVTTSADGMVRLWSITTGRRRAEWFGHRGGTQPLATAPDGSLIVTGGSDGMVRLWEPPTGRRLAEWFGHMGGVTSAAVAPDASWLATAGADEMVRLWRLPTGEPHGGKIKHRGGVESVVAAPDGSWLATAGKDGRVRLWDVPSGRRTAEWLAHRGRVAAMTTAPDASWLATAGKDGRVRLWDVRSGRRLGDWTGVDGGAALLAVAPDGSWLATAAGDGRVRLCDPVSGELLAAWSAHLDRVTSMTVAPNGSWLAVADARGRARIWDLTGTAEPLPADVPAPRLLADLAERLVRAEDRLVTFTGMGSAARLRSRWVLTGLSRRVDQLWRALSDFPGADLRDAIGVGIGDLDGVRWSDDTAAGGSTIWPSRLRSPVRELSVPTADPGVFVVRSGTTIGAAR